MFEDIGKVNYLLVVRNLEKLEETVLGDFPTMAAAMVGKIDLTVLHGMIDFDFVIYEKNGEYEICLAHISDLFTPQKWVLSDSLYALIRWGHIKFTRVEK